MRNKDEQTSADRKQKYERRHGNSNFPSTGNKAIIISDNSDGGRQLGSRLKSVITSSMDKRKGLMIYEDQKTLPSNFYQKRKDSFTSQKIRLFSTS